VTLLGQTVNSYAHVENGASYRLADLIGRIHDVLGIERIKFVTNFPKDMSDDLLRAVADLPKVARYLHVPLQSGCDDVLRRMKRGYTVGEYRDMMHRIHATVPGCAVSSDFIVGFSGETEESFQRTVDAVREFRFKNSFIFKYSPRGGTKAVELYIDDVAEETKRRRNNELLDEQTQISAEDNAAFIGNHVSVLVEGPSKNALKAAGADGIPGWHDAAPKSGVPAATPAELPGPAIAAQLVGRTDCDRIVVFDGNPRLAGTMADILIEDCTATTLMGSIVTRSLQHGSSEMLPILN